MDIAQVRAELIQLRKEIRRHNKKYYEQDAPEITDYEYDKTSPTQIVGGSARREAGKIVAHDVQMLSLQDVFSKDEVENFIRDSIEKLDAPEFVVEEKIDGLSLALRYADGTEHVLQGKHLHIMRDDFPRLAPRRAANNLRRRSLHDARGFFKDERSARTLGLENFCQPAKLRGGHVAPTGQQNC